MIDGKQLIKLESVQTGNKAKGKKMIRWRLQTCVILGYLMVQAVCGLADDSPDFVSKVAPILASKCLRCHGENRAENEFRIDKADELESFISATDLEGSSLWADYLTTDDEDVKMPPSKEKQLTQAELETVKQWILTSGEVVAIENWAILDTQDQAARNTNDLPTALWVLLGRFHPALVHFPIALLTVAAFFAIFAFGNEHMNKSAVYCLVLGSLGSLAAVAAGWGFADYSQWGDWNADAIGSSKWQHRWGGVGVAVLACVVTMMAFYARNQTDRGQFFWKLGTVILAAMVGWVGHEGGELHYGDIYAVPVSRVQELLQQQFSSGPTVNDIQDQADKESQPAKTSNDQPADKDDAEADPAKPADDLKVQADSAADSSQVKEAVKNSPQAPKVDPSQDEAGDEVKQEAVTVEGEAVSGASADKELGGEPKDN